MVYGYDAQFLTTDAPIVNISDFATQLVMSLRAKNIDSPIIFVAHSMGGLVCKLVRISKDLALTVPKSVA